MPSITLNSSSIPSSTAAEREADVVLAVPDVAEPAGLVMVPAARALAWFEASCSAT